MNNKIIRVLLFVVLLVIWGIITVQVVQSLREEETNNEPIHIQSDFHKSVIEQYVYNADVRDPFQRKPKIVTQDSSKKKAVEKVAIPEWIPPPMKLTGILINNSKRVATIESKDGVVDFLHEGDTLRGMKVLKINANSVSFSYQKKTMDWQLETVSK